MKTDDKVIYTKAATNEAHNAFVGIRIRNDRVDFSYPESYDLAPLSDPKAFRRDLLEILQTISLAKTVSSPAHSTDTALSKDQNFVLISYLWIIRDYLAHGYYRNTETRCCINGKGKVNWKKTLETQPIISGGNVIYNRLVVQTRSACDDILTEAHRLCVFDAVRKMGWLFSISEQSVYFPHVSSHTVKKYMQAVRSALVQTFDDAKRLRLNHMLKVLGGVDPIRQADEIVYGVDQYHYVYERMIDALFRNVSDIQKYNPSASWYLVKNDFEEAKASSLRPDTIRIEDRAAYILDAKLYRFGATGREQDLPETTSIQKQITYGDHMMTSLRAAGHIQTVRNAFLLPYNKRRNPFGLTGDLEYIGYSKASWRSNQLGHEKVHAFFIDMKHLVSSWTQGNCQADIDVLIREIEKYSEE